MIKIVKDDTIKVVTKGAYDNLYKHLGYDIISEKKEVPYYESEVKDKKDKDIAKEKDEKETRK